MTQIRLGVNIDHVATLRQQRGGTVNYPSLLVARDLAIRGGADQITVHLRADRRHIQEKDLNDLSQDRTALLNLEMASTQEMIRFAVMTRPDIVCLVPEKREELTTEGGLDVLKHRIPIQSVVEQCKKNKIKVSLFIEPIETQIAAAQDLGADAVEFHTGQYSLATGPEQKRLLDVLFRAFELAHGRKLAVHAGHGLDYQNVIPLLKGPHLEELNIGHSIVCRAVLVGMEQAVREMKTIIMQRSSGLS